MILQQVADKSPVWTCSCLTNPLSDVSIKVVSDVEDSAPSEVKPVRTGELRCADCGYSTRITHWFEWEIQDGPRGFCPSCGSRRTSVAKVGEELSSHATPDPPKKNSPYDPYGHIVLSGPKFPDLPKRDLREQHKRKQICRECKQEFVPGPNHKGYINVCRECGPK